MEKGPKVLFNPLSSGVGLLRGASVSRPPAKLYLPSGPILSAWKTENPYGGKRSRHSGAQKAGLAYQKRVGRFLPSPSGQWVVSSGPWFAYTCSDNKRHYCQPDFLLVDEANSTIVVVEVKIRWTDAAWWQVNKLYLPVLQRVSPHMSLLSVVICRSYDPAIQAPEPITLCSDLMDIKPGRFNVLVYK